MRKIIYKIKNDNNGTALVMVIIALAFVGILAITVMWMSLANYRMKASDKATKKGFYTAETVFEQIVAGLQGESSKAAGSAYRKVMQSYATAGGDGERYSRFVKYYKEDFINNIKSTSVNGIYDEDKMRSYLDNYLTSKLSAGDDGNKLTMSGVINESGTGYDYITLEGFELEFTDENGYYSKINTDIMITAPKVTFTMSSSMPDIFKYAIVADDKVIKTDVGNSNISGNVYAGEDGVEINGKVVVENTDYFISMGKIRLLGTQAQFTIQHDDTVNSQLWAQGIDIDSRNKQERKASISGGKLDIDADTYVEDDLTLYAPGCDAKLAGRYRGYGSSETNAAKSSAIMVNNLNSTLDMTDLDELTLSGYSFVSLSSYSRLSGIVPLPGVPSVSANDVLMGESVAVKSDQIAFLIPEECLWVDKDENPTKFSQNPVVYDVSTAQELVDGCCGGDESKIGFGSSGSGYDLYRVKFDRILDTSKTNSNTRTLGYYGINSRNDIVEVYSNTPGGGLLIYYYMKMPVNMARTFIQEYYGDNSKKMEQYYEAYTHPDTAPVRISAPKGDIRTKGTFIADKIAGVDAGELIHANTIITNEDKDKLDAEVQSYQKIMNSLTKTLTEGGEENTSVGSVDPHSEVFEFIINETAVTSFLSGGAGETELFTLDDGYYGVITKTANYEYNDSTGKCRLIVALGNVSLKENFTGVVFAKGTVSIENGCSQIKGVENTGSSDAKMQLVRVLQCKLGHGGPSRENVIPLNMFNNGASYVLAGTQVTPRDDAGTSSDKVDILNTVNYKNWVKK